MLWADSWKLGTNAVILYHHPCKDGMAAAWAITKWARNKYTYLGGPVYIGVNYGQPLPVMELDKFTDVYILDFSYSREILTELAARVNSIVVVDHHKTAEETLGPSWTDCPDNVRVLFEMKKSGAMMTWELFNEAPPPALITYVQDEDLWKFELLDSKVLGMYIENADKNIYAYQELHDRMRSELIRCASIGVELWKYKSRLCNDIVEQARPCTINTLNNSYSGLVCNCTGHFASDVGHLLALKSETFGLTYSVDRLGGYKFSIRSTKESGFDVTKIAKEFGGGGHFNAAGFYVTNPNFLTEITEPINVNSPSKPG